MKKTHNERHRVKRKRKHRFKLAKGAKRSQKNHKQWEKARKRRRK